MTSHRMTSRPGCRKRQLVRHLGLVGFIVALCLVTQPGFADDSARIAGLWRLVSYEIEAQATGEKIPLMGQRPTGFANFSPDGRVFFLLTGEGRQPAKTDQERAELLNTLVSYTGRYRIEGDRWITKVEVAWNPEWVGTEQSRSFKIDGDRLQVMSPWRVMPNWADKGLTRSLVTFERASSGAM